MSTETLRTMIVTAAKAAVARAVAAALSPAGAGMFTTGLVPKAGPAGVEPTHFISSGKIGVKFADLLASGGASALFAASVAGAESQGLQVTWTESDCAALLASAYVSGEPPFVAMVNLGLQLYSPNIDEDAASTPWYTRTWNAIKGVFIST